MMCAVRCGFDGSIVCLTHLWPCRLCPACPPCRRWAEAAAAYETAGDMDSVVRLSLEKLGAPQRAYAIVRKTQSVEAASQLARFCLQSQDFAVRQRVVSGGWYWGDCLFDGQSQDFAVSRRLAAEGDWCLGDLLQGEWLWGVDDGQSQAFAVREHGSLPGSLMMMWLIQPPPSPR